MKVTAGVTFLVVADDVFVIASVCYERNSIDLACQATQPFGIIALVAKEVAHAPGAFEAFMSLTLPSVSFRA